MIPWAVAFGMMRAQISGLREDLRDMSRRFDRSDERHDRVVEDVHRIGTDVAVLAGLANASEDLRRRSREKP